MAGDSKSNGGRDKFFIIVLIIFGTLTIIFGGVAIALTLWGDPSEKVIFRIIGAMGSMFTGMIGLALGFLSSRS